MMERIDQIYFIFLATLIKLYQRYRAIYTYSNYKRDFKKNEF